MDARESTILVPADDEAARLRLLVDYDELLRRGESLVVPGASTRVAGSTDAHVCDCLDVLEFVYPRAAAAAALPERVGRFVVEKMIGQGGFGIVYLARDPSLGRAVALKIPRPHVLCRQELRERFMREARAAARLDHPHIVPVHEVGIDGGVCYISSAYCDGGTLHDWLQRQKAPVPVELAVQLVIQLADAVQHAHERGVLHRDLKLANILLVNDVPLPPFARGGQGGARGMLSEGSPIAEESRRRTTNDRLGVQQAMAEVHSHAAPPDPPLARGGLAPTLRIADFGLAKFFDDDEGQTQSGVVFGTPLYMPPEQAASGTKQADARGDVYSLGAILYALLVGRPPFAGGDYQAVIRKLLTEPAPSPKLVRRDVPRDLETVYLKATARDREQRYASAGALAADLRRCLASEPIAVRRPREPLGKKLLTRRNFAGLALSSLPVIGYAMFAGGQQAEGNERLVTLTTNPAGAKIWFIPLSMLTGEPEPERIIEAGKSPVELPLAPGDYLVEAVLDDGRFHEVYRHVPENADALPGVFNHQNWKNVPQGRIELPKIKLPGIGVFSGMAGLAGNAAFAMGRAGSTGIPLHYRSIPPFLMDPVEFTYADYRTLLPGSAGNDPPENLTERHARPLNFDQALMVAERFGKRLPDEAEFEYAATADGTREFPDEASLDTDFGPAGTPAFDRVDLDPGVPIYGLCSNVAEWTTSWPVIYLAHELAGPVRIESAGRHRVFRGGSDAVAGGSAAVTREARDARARGVELHYHKRPGLGVRLVRSVQPRLGQNAFPTVLTAALTTGR